MLGHVSIQTTMLQREKTMYESNFYSKENMNAAKW